LSDTSLSSSSESVLAIGNGMLHLISSGVANYGSFPFSSALLHLIHILLEENVLSHAIKLIYSFFNSLLKHLMFFEKCKLFTNCTFVPSCVLDLFHIESLYLFLFYIDMLTT
jgi:hypothetical protein